MSIFKKISKFLGIKGGDYNKTRREFYPDDYKEIVDRIEKYKQAHPEISQFRGAKS
jgi:hypothetical protein